MSINLTSFITLMFVSNCHSKPLIDNSPEHVLPLVILFSFLGLVTLLVLYVLIRLVLSLNLFFNVNDPRNFEGWTEESIQSYELARAFEQAHPPNSIPTDITPELRQLIQEKGVFAWHFGGDLDLNVIVNDRTELTFLGGDNCIQTNIPIPKQQPIYYFEVKMFEMSNTTKVAVGLATKPYPSWRFPGMNKNSLGYFSNDGRKRYNDPFSGQEFGPTYCEGDVIGCGYRPRSGTVFFTKNGVKIGDSQSGFRYNLFPTISADGPCQLHVNLGQMGFVFIEANVGKWGLAPCEGSLLPPPAYGQVRDSILLECALENQNLESSSHKPPSYLNFNQNVPELRLNVNSPPPSYLEPNEDLPLLADYDSDE